MTMKIAHNIPPTDDLVALYTSVGWSTYAEDPGALTRAVVQSAYVVSAWSDDQLIGLARCVSDDVSITYLQDVLVHSDFQRRGIGRQLLRDCIERFEHVRQFVLLTDDDPMQLAFYESLGLINTRGLQKRPLNAFVRIIGVELT